MSEVQYLKCACKECGNGIEFPADAAGNTVACPHCGQWTELLVPQPPAKSGTLRLGLFPQILTLVLLVAVIAGAMAFWRYKARTVREKSETNQVAVSPGKKLSAPGLIVSQPATGGTTPPVATNATPRAKSPADLKVGEIQLEKTKGSSLVYAIGTVKNDSEFDRYGIRIELDVFNSKKTKIAGAKDYKDYLGPHQDWRFHALIPDPKAATAQVASLKEDQ